MKCGSKVQLFTESQVKKRRKSIFPHKKTDRKLVVSAKSSTFALGFKNTPADMAQLVEQRIRNAWVRGSSPRVGSSEKKKDRRCLP